MQVKINTQELFAAMDKALDQIPYATMLALKDRKSVV